MDLATIDEILFCLTTNQSERALELLNEARRRVVGEEPSAEEEPKVVRLVMQLTPSRIDPCVLEHYKQGVRAEEIRGKRLKPGCCTQCQKKESPEWRKGPCGPGTLCNACGLKWAKEQKRNLVRACFYPNQ